MDLTRDREKLRSFFHRHKAEMSSMDNPYTFLRKLRDNDLIPEDRYQEMDGMKSKNDLERAVYEALGWLEREHPERIIDFWDCAFSEGIMQLYSTLQLLYKKLKDGQEIIATPISVISDEDEETDDEEQDEQQPEGSHTQPGASSESMDSNAKRKKMEKTNERKRKRPSLKNDGGEKKANSEQPSTSSSLIPESHFREGERSNMRMPDPLPVTCGKEEGKLYRHKLANSEKCIKVGEDWFTPPEFERFAGRESSRNWKSSIRCGGITLGKLIEDGDLESGHYKKQSKASKSLPPRFSDEDEETDEEDQDEQQPEGSHECSKVFQVTCGDKAGTLHAKRFASGVRGKCIRTERSWMTPEQFFREASLQSGTSWRKDIICDGNPLDVLIEEETLSIHSFKCDCIQCKPGSKDLENEKNDDECFICKRGVGELVECDHCPCSFHPKCHLPHVDDAILRDNSPWICTLCVFRDNQPRYYPDNLTREAAMSARISQHLLRCQYLLLRLSCADQEQTFAFNPGLYVEDYSTVIKTPMWLRKIAEKLQLQQYQTVGQFVSDVQLIFTNWTKYNQEDAESCARAKTLKNLFDSEFKKAFNIKTVQ